MDNDNQDDQKAIIVGHKPVAYIPDKDVYVLRTGENRFATIKEDGGARTVHGTKHLALDEDEIQAFALSEANTDPQVRFECGKPEEEAYGHDDFQIIVSRASGWDDMVYLVRESAYGDYDCTRVDEQLVDKTLRDAEREGFPPAVGLRSFFREDKPRTEHVRVELLGHHSILGAAYDEFNGAIPSGVDYLAVEYENTVLNSEALQKEKERAENKLDVLVDLQQVTTPPFCEP